MFGRVVRTNGAQGHLRSVSRILPEKWQCEKWRKTQDGVSPKPISSVSAFGSDSKSSSLDVIANFDR